MTDLSAEFADGLLLLTAQTLTPGDHEQACRLLTDFAICAYSGSQQRTALAAADWATAYAGTGRSILIGRGERTVAPVAALVNGTATHSYELDDTHDLTLSHPASVVVPAALAAAAERGSTGAEFIAAVIAGYQAMARIGTAANAANVIEDGHHPTALFGGFGAAAAAAKLKHFSSRQLRCAWGHALSMAGGSMQFSDETEGAEIKRIHAGLAAYQGVLATELAQVGIQAPQRALDGKYGFLKLFGRDAQPALLLEPRDRLAIHDISFKPYACCRQFHAVIDGLQDATHDFADTSAIVAIIIRGPRVLADQHMLRRPASAMAAQYSLPFTVGATLEFGPMAYDAFATENLANEGALRWADMVQAEFDAELQRQYPAHFGAEVELRFSDGEIRRRRVLDSRGTPARPFTWNHVADKAGALCGRIRPALDFERLRDVVTALPQSPDVGAFEALLGAEIARSHDLPRLGAGAAP